jgi:hypothetical protein
MASARKNPNDRRRINLVSRAVMKKGLSPEQAVALWLETGSGPAFRAATGLKRGGAAQVAAGIDARPQSKARKKQYAQAKAAVRKAFKDLGGPAYGSGYPTRAGSSHAKRYKRNKQHNKRGGSKTAMVFGRRMTYPVVDRSAVRAWNTSRQTGRATGRYGQIPAGHKMSGSNRGHRIPWGGYPAAVFGGAQAPMAPAPEGMSYQDLVRQHGVKKAAEIWRQAKSNPFGSASALQNPSFAGAGAFLTGYALPVAVAGAAAGGVHALASQQGLTETLGEFVSKVPVAGEFVAENAPYTLQGLIAGSVLGLVAPMVGGVAGKYLALTAGGAIAFGGGIDAFNYFLGGEGESEELDELLAEDDVDLDEELAGLAFGDLALTNVSALGDLALTNTSALGDLALTNGMSFEGGDLSSGDYGQASLADAYYSGADFSGAEGQALLNGRRKWRRRYPIPRSTSRKAGGCSHLAGREGHRWGWMIKSLGWERARAIAALPPRKRCAMIAKLRQACIASFNQLMLEAKALEAEAVSPDAELIPAAGTAATGANGATGATNYLGDPALFMGA